ncbi:TPA: MmcQ family protein, partial [Streptococcus agalactiae]|nr:MmcQ family protein [Streptococcus agalactiae]
MSIESDFFRKKRFIFSSLEEFGFIKSDQEYIYCQTFMDNDFKAIITISLDGKIAGKVIDSALEEEYLPLRAANYNGSFVGEVRSAYMAILGDISDSCCK